MGEGNGGFLPLGGFKTKFKFAEGTRQIGAPRSKAGATVEMGWNQAMLAQAQGWGEMQIGRRPHHARPHLMSGGRAPTHELRPNDGLSPQERARLRVSQNSGRGKAAGATHVAARTGGGVGNVVISSSRCHGSVGTGGDALKEQQRRPPRVEADWEGDEEGGQENKDKERNEEMEETFTGLAEGSGERLVPYVREAFACAPLLLSRESPAAATAAGSASRSSFTEDADRREFAGEANVVLEGLQRAWAVHRNCLERRDASASGGTGMHAKIVSIGGGATFVGEVDSHCRPHGEGVLLLPDGAQHVGRFCGGRADGPGFYLMPKGIVHQGSWRHNLRLGEFVVVDARGAIWCERYNDEGKKVSRKRAPGLEGTSPGPTALATSQHDGAGGTAAIELAAECVSCGQLFHGRFDHPYACRRHRGDWVECGDNGEHDSKDEDRRCHGIWSCCGSLDRLEPGCEFSMHQRRQ